MKNNKGFTLIELVAVILVLGVIALIAVPVVNNAVINSKNKLYDRQVDTIIKATKEYVILHNDDFDQSLIVTLEDLSNSGLLDVKTIKNPKTGEEMNGYVRVEYVDNEFTYTYIEDTSRLVYNSIIIPKASFEVYPDFKGFFVMQTKETSSLFMENVEYEGINISVEANTAILIDGEGNALDLANFITYTSNDYQRLSSYFSNNTIIADTCSSNGTDCYISQFDLSLVGEASKAISVVKDDIRKKIYFIEIPALSEALMTGSVDYSEYIASVQEMLTTKEFADTVSTIKNLYSARTRNEAIQYLLAEINYASLCNDLTEEQLIEKYTNNEKIFCNGEEMVIPPIEGMYKFYLFDN